MEEVFEGRDSVEGVEEIGYEECLVGWVVHDGGGKVIETEHVCHLTITILHTQQKY